AAARRRIDRALQRGEAIAVHGDYDVDGITATFLLVEVLRDLGGDVRWHLPNRFVEGYGVAVQTVEEMAGAGVRLLITVDCGITARAEVARARELGRDVVGTDHPVPEGPPPDGILVTPKLGDYPFRDLAGVGVALKLAHALLQSEGAPRVELPLALRPFTDVVALGTVADLVPLRDENRSLVAMGLGRLRSAPRPGLAALMEVAGVEPAALTAGSVGFRLAPRLNAAGRLEDAAQALELLGCADRAAALPIAVRLDELNRERQAIEQAMVAAATEMVPDPPPPALVLSSPDWHEGVVGIVASRVAERFNRPAILLSEGDETAKGSGRSIAGFDLLAAVEAAAGHLLAFGGHRAACGVRLPVAAIPAFRAEFTAAAARALTDDDLVRVRRVDAVVCGDELTLELADEIEQLAPYGLGNPRPALLLHGARIEAPRLTRDRRHLRCRVACDGACASAVHFEFPGAAGTVEEGRYDVPLMLGKDAYNGRVSAQVEVKALHLLDDGRGDLCATPCDLGCRDRLAGAALWRELLDAPPAAAAVAEERAAAAGQARRDGRLRDLRGRPIASTLVGLVAAGGPLVVVAADVARRRPLLTRDVLPPELRRGGLYLHGACVAGRAGLAGAGDVVLVGHDVALARPELLRAAAHVAFIDPPPTRLAFDALLAAAGPDAWLHILWGRGEVDFADKVARSLFDLQPVSRLLWRALAAAGGRFGEVPEQELFLQGPYLRPLAPLAAALRAFTEAGLAGVVEGGLQLERPDVKTDLTGTETYRAWHRLFQTNDFTESCLTRPL
ncbi:MAG TPA: single-stranded-DNA-specific exonuclease RecJ, partial [Thermoleophilia bacterium]|nr:single-stranded-DNA-specific exonuclease RecJ [Thermoleophilia bacterium]